ncbi:MAG: LacI family transcriptional regulator, partial [Actinomycetales bacterium]|nr:LacI family transcriptional regulator [Actinomycetales bacterium]
MTTAARDARRAVVVVTVAFDAYQIALVRGMLEVLAPRDVPLVVYCTQFETARLPESLVCLLRHHSPVGVITMDVNTAEQREALLGLLAELRLPTVHIAQDVPGAACVRGDNDQGMSAVMAHLLDERGVRRPVMIRGFEHAADHIERERVFRRELAARGLAVDEELVIDGQARHDVADQELRKLLRRRTDMDAVVTTDDYVATAVMKAVTDHGLRVPGDVAVTGFDNYPTSAMTWPGITTVDQNLPDQGRVAAELLLAQLEGGHPAGGAEGGEPPEGAEGGGHAARVEVPCTLVVRGSTLTAEGGVDELIRTAVRITRTATGHSRAQDAIVGMSRDLLGCRSLDDVGGVLAAHAGRVGLTRCFLVAFDLVPDLAEDGTDGHGTDRYGTAWLVADVRDGRAHVPDPERFSSCRLL